VTLFNQFDSFVYNFDLYFLFKQKFFNIIIFPPPIGYFIFLKNKCGPVVQRNKFETGCMYLNISYYLCTFCCKTCTNCSFSFLAPRKRAFSASFSVPSWAFCWDCFLTLASNTKISFSRWAYFITALSRSRLDESADFFSWGKSKHFRNNRKLWNLETTFYTVSICFWSWTSLFIQFFLLFSSSVVCRSFACFSWLSKSKIRFSSWIQYDNQYL